MKKKLTLKQMQKLAKSRGGECLSQKYVNARTKLRWRCEKGHEWKAIPENIIKGCWCPACGHIRGGLAQRSTIEEMRKIAESRGGRCLSKKYSGDGIKLRWMCGKGHKWEVRPSNIKQGRWCPFCSHRVKLTIKEMQQLASKRGGKCLSKKYIDNETKLKWRCKKGHVWEAIPSSVKRGSWCPFCSNAVKLTIEEMQYLASKNGGVCLSKKYINKETKLKWRCKEGHVWEAIPSSIKRGSWCPFCSHRVKLTIEEMQSIARERGGECLSKKYVNSYTTLKWRCKKGHKWNATPKSIKKGNWCSVCARRRETIENMQKLAEERGGECLSKEYARIDSKYNWKCKEGHVWRAKPHYIEMGNWCPICSNVKRLDDFIEEIHELAKSRGGKCLSKKYVGNKTKLRFQCKEGHIWKTTPAIIKSGYWCPICSNVKRLDDFIEDIHELAKSRGGKCLSKKYVDNQTKLRFQCKEGHIWKTTPATIKSGCWCPRCNNVRVKDTKRMQFERYNEIAKERGGRCLSKKYVNQNTKLQWECKEGHRWHTPPSIVRSGSWCPVCAKERRNRRN